MCRPTSCGPTLAAVDAEQVMDVDDHPCCLGAGPTAAALVLDQLVATVG